MKSPAQFDEAAMQRIAVSTRRFMYERGSEEKVAKWLLKNETMVKLLAHCTWLAIREELER